MRVLMVDNYDSFTYNLVHPLEALGAEVVVAAKRRDLATPHGPQLLENFLRREVESKPEVTDVRGR